MAESPELTRRDFLTLRKSEQTVDTNIQASIQRELGLNPDIIQLSMVFGNHVLTPDYVADIKKRKANVVMGEFSRDSLRMFPYQALSDSPDTKADGDINNVLERLLNPGEGASSEEIVYNDRAIQDLIKCDATFGALDVDVGSHLELPKIAPIAIEGGILLMLSALPAYAGLARIVNSRKGEPLLSSHPTRRRFLKLAAGASSAVGVVLSKSGLDLAGIDLFGHKLMPRKIPINEGKDIKGVDFFMGLEMDFEEAYARFGMDKDTFGTYTQAVVDFRNKVMALNTWHSIARYGQGKDGQQARLYFNAGYAHANIYHEFLSGITKLESEVGKYAEKLTGESLDAVIDEWDKELASDPAFYKGFNVDDDIIDYYKDLAQMFGKPYFVGSQIPHEPTSTIKRIPQTPQAIIIDTMTKALAHYKQDSSPLAKRKAAILQGVLEKVAIDIQTEYGEKPFNNEYDLSLAQMAPLSVNEQTEAEIKSTLYSGFDYNIKRAQKMTAETGKTVLAAGPHYGPNDMMNIGIAKYNGEYHRVGRDIRVDSSTNKLVVTDVLILPGDRFIPLQRSEYAPMEESVDEETRESLVYLEKKTWSGLSEYFAIHTANNNNSPESSFNIVYGVEIVPIVQLSTTPDRTEKSAFYSRLGKGKDWAGIDRIELTEVTFT